MIIIISLQFACIYLIVHTCIHGMSTRHKTHLVKTHLYLTQIITALSLFKCKCKYLSIIRIEIYFIFFCILLILSFSFFFFHFFVWGNIEKWKGGWETVYLLLLVTLACLFSSMRSRSLSWQRRYTRIYQLYIYAHALLYACQFYIDT